MKRDYYAVLEIAKTASEDEIKKAYKRLAKEYHPDVAKDKKDSEEKFKEINEAYQILSDPQKRKAYDQFGHAGTSAQGGNWNPFTGGQSGSWGPFSYSYSSSGNNSFDFGEGFDPFDIFEQVFGFRGYGARTRVQKGKSLHFAINVSFGESLKGCEKVIKILGKELKVKIPAGIRNGAQMKFAGEGEPSSVANGQRGDLFLEIRISDFPREIERDEEGNILTRIVISYPQAVLGDTVEIISIDPKEQGGLKKIKLKIPEGTQNGTTFRIRSQGFPEIGGRGRKDHFVEVKIEIPQKVNSKQKQILEELKKIS